MFNEARAIDDFVRAVRITLDPLPDLDYEFVFVDDGSTDDTLGVLLAADAGRGRIRVVELTRNFVK